MKIRSRLNPSKPCFSFEFFPPKTPEGEKQLWDTLEDLRSLEPGFVSVTSGAGGSTRDRTIELVTHIKERTGIEAMAHLTCVGHTKEEIAEVLSRLAKARVENVLALRGDPPKGQATFQRTEGGLGFGTLTFLADSSGAVTAYGWSGTWSEWYVVTKVVFGRVSK